jgi:hypothetical protein
MVVVYQLDYSALVCISGYQTARRAICLQSAPQNQTIVNNKSAALAQENLFYLVVFPFAFQTPESQAVAYPLLFTCSALFCHVNFIPVVVSCDWASRQRVSTQRPSLSRILLVIINITGEPRERPINKRGQARPGESMSVLFVCRPGGRIITAAMLLVHCCCCHINAILLLGLGEAPTVSQKERIP